MTRVSCFCYKSKSYLHSSILQIFFFPACRSLDSYAWFFKTSGSCRWSTDESSTRNQSNFEVCVFHVILRFFTEPTCSAVKIVGHYIWRNFSGRAYRTVKGEQDRSLRSADVFPVVASLPPTGIAATTGNTSALLRLATPRIGVIQMSFSNRL